MVTYQSIYLRGLLLIPRPSDLYFLPFSLPNGASGDSWEFGRRVGRRN